MYPPFSQALLNKGHRTMSMHTGTPLFEIQRVSVGVWVIEGDE